MIFQRDLIFRGGNFMEIKSKKENKLLKENEKKKYIILTSKIPNRFIYERVAQ
jgi:hypothetical protein